MPEFKIIGLVPATKAPMPPPDVVDDWLAEFFETVEAHPEIKESAMLFAQVILERTPHGPGQVEVLRDLKRLVESAAKL